MGYYAQSVSGHLDLMRRARPVPDWLAEGSTPEALRERLQLALRINNLLNTMPDYDATVPGSATAPYSEANYNSFGRWFF